MKAKLTKNIQSVIERCYSNDDELLEKWHIIAPTTHRSAVLHTLSVFRKSDKFKMYELFEKGKFAGYIGVEETDLKYINGFFIMPKYRKKEYFEKFFDMIRHLVGEGAYIPVYAKNERAATWLAKNGCSFIKEAMDKEIGATYKVFQI